MESSKGNRLVKALLLTAVFLWTWTLPVQAEGTVLRVGFKEHTYFYQFTDENGNVDGIHVDFLEAMAPLYGYELAYYPMEKLWDCLDALERGEVDVVLGVPSYVSGDFAASVEMTTANLSVMASEAFLDGRDLAHISDYTAVLEHNTANNSVLSNMSALTYIVTGSQKEVLDVHLSGQAQVLIADYDCISYLLKERGIQEAYKVVQSNIDTIGYAMAVKKENVTLLRTLNDGLMKLRLTGEDNLIRSKWIPEKPDNLAATIAEIIRIALLFCIAVGIAFGIFALITTRIRNLLKREVKEKTLELGRRVRQLQEESELRNRIIELSPNGMVLFDQASQVTLMNSSACRMIGAEAPPIGRSIYQISLFGEILKRHWGEGAGFTRQEVGSQMGAFPVEGSGARIYHYSILPMPEEEWGGCGLITVEDVTVDEAEKQNIIEREKNKALNRMMAGIAHEIKNPLTGIRNFAELIYTRRDDKQFLDYFALLVPKEVDRISRLIESLMQYARPPKGNKELINLSAVAEECVFLAKAAVKSPLVRVETSLSEKLHAVADRDQIKQVLLNIMMNSIASMEKKLQGGWKTPLLLQVTTLAQGTSALVVIRDEGEGMSPEVLQNCTDPFFTSKSSGTGLGLALSKQFIGENDGVLCFESIEGIETVVTVQLRGHGG